MNPCASYWCDQFHCQSQRRGVARESHLDAFPSDGVGFAFQQLLDRDGALVSSAFRAPWVAFREVYSAYSPRYFALEMGEVSKENGIILLLSIIF